VLKTFPKGGVHPAENKISADSPIKKLKLPEQVAIPVDQHMGAPAKPLVSKGDKVRTGQKIAESAGFISTNIHSSVSGTVLKIDKVMDTTGYKQAAIIIKVEGDEWDESIDRSEDIVREFTAGPEDIVKKVLESGIVGLGGATFPTHVKLSVPKGKKADVFILNGAECEPYLTSDHRMMLEKGEELLTGMEIIMKALDVNKAYIGIENNKPDAIRHLEKIAADHKDIEVCALKTKYPQGGEKQLIKTLTGREVPSGGLPVDVGAVVHNVGTTFAVYEAVQKNKPLFERVVTVTGTGISGPSNFLVRIGTPVSALIEAAGGLPADCGKVINGGPMMGKALNTIDVPVTKGTSGILVIDSKGSNRREVQNCIRCARCVSVCPLGLEPYLLMSLAERSLWERCEQENILDCMECGSCSYTCPSARPLLDHIRLGKATIINLRKAKQK